MKNSKISSPVLPLNKIRLLPLISFFVRVAGVVEVDRKLLLRAVEKLSMIIQPVRVSSGDD